MDFLKDINGRDNAEKIYIYVQMKVIFLIDFFIPVLRRIQRLLFLPYCYFYLVNWKVCKESRLKVIYDFLYIFFILKSFPDNYFQCRLWEKSKKEWPLYYGSNYNPWQRYLLQKYVQPKKNEVLYEDKRVCELLCRASSIPVPNSFGLVSKGEKFGSIYSKRGASELPKKIILKPIEGKGGHAIKVLSTDIDSQLIDLNQNKNISEFIAPCNYIVQEFLSQHSMLNRFSKSVNTVRLVSCLDNNGVPHIIGTYVRFGRSSSHVDNLSQGGMAVKVDKLSGKLIGMAVDRLGNLHDIHPDSNIMFAGVQLPFWQEIIDLGKEVQTRLYFDRLLGMDIAITDSGPVLIEINAIYDNVDLEQMCGPTLKDPTTLKIYNDCGLLYNSRQKKLAKDLV